MSIFDEGVLIFFYFSANAEVEFRWDAVSLECLEFIDFISLGFIDLISLGFIDLISLGTTTAKACVRGHRGVGEKSFVYLILLLYLRFG